MKVIFMGTPEFSVGTLEAIYQAGHEVCLVVTQPDKPKGRGHAMQFTPVKEFAVSKNIEVFQPVKIKESSAIEKLKSYQADICVVAAFGQILPKEILNMCPYGCINVHASLLPKYRGAAPIQWVIIDGEKESGVTIMQMNEGLDTGDMISKVVVPIEKKETGGTYHDKLAEAGAKLCVDTMKEIEAGTAVRTPQTDSDSCYAKMLRKELGLIDFQKEAAEIEHLIRGLNPWPSAYTSLDGKTLKIWAAEVIDKEYEGKPGTIVEKTKKSLLVKTAKGTLAITELQLAGKKRMTTESFLLGYPVEVGQVLGTDSDD
ncbi:MAG: methionyl-tRNA formyltransferase [Lachnospiraceae bacterium]|nr:methionyl-tRNA formyltransferase [Lachnospiraceae bacterium]